MANGKNKTAKELYDIYKKNNIKPPTILLAPGFPRVEGKKLVYPDGTVKNLIEVVPPLRKTVSAGAREFHLDGGKG